MFLNLVDSGAYSGVNGLMVPCNILYHYYRHPHCQLFLSNCTYFLLVMA